MKLLSDCIVRVAWLAVFSVLVLSSGLAVAADTEPEFSRKFAPVTTSQPKSDGAKGSWHFPSAGLTAVPVVAELINPSAVKDAMPLDKDLICEDEEKDITIVNVVTTKVDDERQFIAMVDIKPSGRTYLAFSLNGLPSEMWGQQLVAAMGGGKEITVKNVRPCSHKVVGILYYRFPKAFEMLHLY